MPFFVMERWPASPGFGPAIYATCPVVDKGRIVLHGSVGPRVLGKPVELAPGHEHLNPVQAMRVYAPDGALRATGGRHG